MSSRADFHRLLVVFEQFNGNLYLLVTDCGYQDVPQVVWEKLDMVRDPQRLQLRLIDQL